jgi:polyhydroxyalkanoate synthesis repressor PhaR
VGEGFVTNRGSRSKSGKSGAAVKATGRAARATIPERKRRRGRPPRAASEATLAAYPGERIIHRYGNRRFYDLAESRAVTLEQIAELVRKRHNVRVLDVDQENQDITRRVLTQILLESDDELQLMPIEFLRRLIAPVDKTMVGWMRQYLTMGAEMLDRSARQGLPVVIDFQQRMAKMLDDALMAERMKQGKQDLKDSVARHVKQGEISDQLEDLRKKIEELSKMRGY